MLNMRISIGDICQMQVETGFEERLVRACNPLLERQCASGYINIAFRFSSVLHKVC